MYIYIKEKGVSFRDQDLGFRELGLDTRIAQSAGTETYVQVSLVPALRDAGKHSAARLSGSLLHSLSREH